MKLLVFALLAACGPTPHAQTDASPAPKSDAPIVDIDAPKAAGPVNVVITADNAYSFGYGDVSGITHFTQGVRALTAGQIFNCPIGEGPEAYVVPEADAPEGAYLYIVAWDDLAVTQGVLGQFTRDTGAVVTGDARFEVCATGIDYSTGPDAQVGPNLAVINTEITRCNAGTGDAATTSRGWVNRTGPTTAGALGALAVGEANDDQTGTFPIVCQPANGAPGVRSDAHWMWYAPDATSDPFHSVGTNHFKAFLIFRLAAGSIIE